MKNQKSGFIIINKPSGPTSFNIISKLRKITGTKKIGHAGTLDPFASGVLICAIGRDATKRIKEFVGMDKEYVAEIFLGAETDTYDRTGNVTKSSPLLTKERVRVRFWESKKIFNLLLSSSLKRRRDNKISFEKIEKTIQKFIGPQKQVPPMYSAVKREGKKLYEYAREGKEIERGFSEIEIYDIEILDYKSPVLKIKVKCSSGTYIRSLAYDIGIELGCGAYLEELERTAIGEYKIEDAVDIEDLNEENWKSFLI